MIPGHVQVVTMRCRAQWSKVVEAVQECNVGMAGWLVLWGALLDLAGGLPTTRVVSAEKRKRRPCRLEGRRNTGRVGEGRWVRWMGWTCVLVCRAWVRLRSVWTVGRKLLHGVLCLSRRLGGRG